MSISTPVSVTRNGVQLSLLVGHPNQLMPLQLTLNTSATVLLDSYYIPAASSSSSFPKAANDPTWFKGYISNGDPGADYNIGSDYFTFWSGPAGSANATECYLPALLRRDPNSETRALWGDLGGILGAGPGPALSCSYFTATDPIVKEPQIGVLQSLVVSLVPSTAGPFDPYPAFGLYFISPDAGWMDIGAFNECVFGSKMQFFDQGTPCQWGMRLKNLYMLVDGERTFSTVPVVSGVDSVTVGFDLSLDGFAAPYKVMQFVISTLTFGANKYAETGFDCQLLQRMRRVLIGNTGIELDGSLFVNQTITGPGTLTCSFKFKVDNTTNLQNTFTLGKPFFRKYYVGFHNPTNKIGIAKIVVPTGVANYTNCRKSWKPTSAEMGQSSGHPVGPSGKPSDWPPGSGSGSPPPAAVGSGPISKTLVIALSVVAVMLLITLVALVVLYMRYNRRAKLAQVKTEEPGATLNSAPAPVPTRASVPTSAPVLTSAPISASVPVHVPVFAHGPPVLNPALPTLVVGPEEMVLVPMSVAQSMYSGGPSVPVAPRQAPPVSHHPPPIPNEQIRHEREMEEIRQASGVGLGSGDSELNVPTATVASSSSAAGPTNGASPSTSEELNYLDA
ncbi:hypothetical protein BG005_007159 [Podila minutissima]|nr:hypothetical protein BG005_007159 [Podila minutissima]